MEVKIVNPIVGVTLYFCPKCQTGHQVTYGQKKCDICGVDIQWPNKRGNHYEQRESVSDSKN